MRSSDFVKMGLKNLTRRKLRTSLTVMGVVIGTFSIVVMLSLGIAMTESFNEQIMQMGSLTKITVNRYYYPENDGSENLQPGKQKELDDNVVSKIKEIPHVKAVTPIQSMSMQFYSGKYQAWATVYGILPDAFKYFEFPELAEGRYLTDEDTDAMVCGSDALYFYQPKGNGGDADVDIMKDKVKMTISANYGENNKPKYYNVNFVGKMAESNGDMNWNVYVNIEQMNKWKKELKKSGAKLYDDNKGYSEIWVAVDDVKYVEEVQNKIKTMEYGTYSLADMVKPMQETANTLQLILGGIGAVSMLVSAIGIANTMIMSIYERTKEIGVMKVLGCLITDIKKLFLFEASMIGLIGGGLGVGLSYLASFFMNKYADKIGDALGGIGSGGGKISIIPLWLTLAALGFAMLVGVISGYYPAKRATKIKAIEALRESN